MVSSGAYSYNPAVSDILIEAYERIQIRPAELTPDHILSFRRSINLVQSSWTNRGVNLFKVDLQTVQLVAGVSTYSVPTNTVLVLDVYLRTYSMGAPLSFFPGFDTVNGSTTVTITQPDSNAIAGNYVNVVIPVSIGGILIYGFYKVTSVLSPSQYTISVLQVATSTASGGVVPVFYTTADSNLVEVTLPNHNLTAGEPFVVQVSTMIGGIVLQGTYTIASITGVNGFVLTIPVLAGFNDTQAENAGYAQVAVQQITAEPIDRVLGSMSRTDYASQPNKTLPGTPSVYWYDRLINPTITVWQPPDINGPYQLNYYRVTQIEDADPKSGQTADIPYRFQEALSSAIAFHLSMKWKPEMSVGLKSYADQMWAEAAAEDREYVPLRIIPDLSGYYRD